MIWENKTKWLVLVQTPSAVLLSVNEDTLICTFVTIIPVHVNGIKILKYIQMCMYKRNDFYDWLIV
jgi:hypothetical protein